MIVTKHAKKRIRQRIGHHRFENQFEEAYINGKFRKDFKGDFKRYLDACSIRNQTNCVVYKNMIYWFNREKVLVTLYQVPSRYMKYTKDKK